MTLTEKEKIKGLEKTTSVIKENYRLTEGTILATLNIVSDKIYDKLPRDFKNTIKKVREEAEAGKHNKSYGEKAVEGVTDFIKVNKVLVPIEQTEIKKNMKDFAKKTISFLLNDNKSEKIDQPINLTDSAIKIIDNAHSKMTIDLIDLFQKNGVDVEKMEFVTELNNKVKKGKDKLINYIYETVS